MNSRHMICGIQILDDAAESRPEAAAAVPVAVLEVAGAVSMVCRSKA